MAKKDTKEQPLEKGAVSEIFEKIIPNEQPTETEPIKITETLEEVEAVVTKGTQFRLKHGQCAIKRKDGKGGICLVMEKYFESKYSKDWIKIESKKK